MPVSGSVVTQTNDDFARLWEVVTMHLFLSDGLNPLLRVRLKCLAYILFQPSNLIH